jgi:D-alanine transaminase
MTRVAYANGRFLPLARACVGVEDRGLQFADGVYEVVKVVRGRPVDLERHLDRLERSLSALRIRPPMSRAALKVVIGEALRRNGLREAVAYIQVDRGRAPRNHLFPKTAVRPTLVLTVRRVTYPRPAEIEEGVGVITLPDERWARCDVKSVSLLPNVLAKQQAAEAGCREAWLVDGEGLVTEGSSSNAYIVDREGRLVTRPLGPEILGGITREVVLELARAQGIPVVERPFSVAEARAAREAFLTSTTSLVLPVTSIDGRPVANGRPGSVTGALLAAYAERTGLSLPQYAQTRAGRA